VPSLIASTDPCLRGPEEIKVLVVNGFYDLSVDTVHGPGVGLDRRAPENGEIDNRVEPQNRCRLQPIPIKDCRCSSWSGPFSASSPAGSVGEVSSYISR
jgi:hypothetical protein